jgi:drug/metabolite transporter (DMT)-like permease
VEQLAVAVVAGISLGMVLLAGRWMYGRLSGSIAARLHASWRWLALPITAVLCGGAFAALRPLIVDQPRTPMWFVFGATGVALLFASATALGWTFVEVGRRIAAASWAVREPDDDDLQRDPALPERLDKQEPSDPE